MNKKLAQKLRASRRNRNESQQKIAMRMGTSQQLVSQLENGKGSLDQLVKICRALGVSLKLQVDDETYTLVHSIHPDERREIEDNIAWFSRRTPGDRLRIIQRHHQAILRLREAASGER